MAKKEIREWISNASDEDIADLIRRAKNRKLKNKHGLDALEIEKFKYVMQLFNKFKIRIPDIKKASKIIDLIELERKKEVLTKIAKDRTYAMNYALYNLYFSSETITATELKSNFKLMCRFLDLFFYEGGSYLRPILLKFFPQEYKAVALDVSGDEEEAISMYHTDVFPYYFNDNKSKAEYLRKLWLASHLHLSGLGDESIIKIIESIDEHPEFMAFA
jgi:hypothetical protein